MWVWQQTTTQESISAEELDLVREAASLSVKDEWSAVPSFDAALRDLGRRWRSLVPADHGERLVEAYRRMYPGLRAAGEIDAWVSSDNCAVLAALIFAFVSPDEQQHAVRAALGLVQWVQEP